ncbi:Hypothetical predicted protein [Octopus vulgaris]|uniref:Uncharacterized protein n=1 Tax=Octopus vulgaris TaxID=6645 RepID=A0AA36BCR5_OCTVU|nr:Hypothetical predicted protein [Octopus vulgaris]
MRVSAIAVCSHTSFLNRYMNCIVTLISKKGCLCDPKASFDQFDSRTRDLPQVPRSLIEPVITGLGSKFITHKATTIPIR